MRILLILLCLQSLSVYSQITKGGGGDRHHKPPTEDSTQDRWGIRIYGDPKLKKYLAHKEELISALNEQLPVCSKSYVATKSLKDIYQHIQTRRVLGSFFQGNENFINDCSQDSFSSCLYTLKVKTKIKAFLEVKDFRKYLDIDLQDKELAKQISEHFEEVVKDD